MNTFEGKPFSMPANLRNISIHFARDDKIFEVAKIADVSYKEVIDHIQYNIR